MNESREPRTEAGGHSIYIEGDIYSLRHGQVTGIELDGYPCAKIYLRVFYVGIECRPRPRARTSAKCESLDPDYKSDCPVTSERIVSHTTILSMKFMGKGEKWATLT